VGTPVYAIASGEVVYADRLDIRGNYVLLHHGWGIYSGYAHFSQLGVQVGQRVEAGQFIGLSGNTGRSSGPHLHWEIAIQGEWIDSLAFLDLWLPAG
jgi:murein DD-endopeptidase MepM/ murein hydrolase activator NlpD